MLIEEVECRARAREKEKAALMRDAKLEVAYNIISEVYREAAAESYPNWTKQKQNDMDRSRGLHPCNSQTDHLPFTQTGGPKHTNITRNLLHEWYHGGARTPADVQRLAQENLGLTLTAEKVKKILEDQIPLEQWYQTRIMAAIRQLYPEAFVRKIAAGVYSERGFPDVLVIIDGLYIGLEIKRPFLGKPTPLQLDTIEAIKRAGGTARVVCLPEEAVEAIEYATAGL